MGAIPATPPPPQAPPATLQPPSQQAPQKPWHALTWPFTCKNCLYKAHTGSSKTPETVLKVLWFWGGCLLCFFAVFCEAHCSLILSARFPLSFLSHTSHKGSAPTPPRLNQLFHYPQCNIPKPTPPPPPRFFNFWSLAQAGNFLLRLPFRNVPLGPHSHFSSPASTPIPTWNLTSKLQLTHSGPQNTKICKNPAFLDQKLFFIKH